MTDPVPQSVPPTSVLFADPDHGPRSQMAEALLHAALGGAGALRPDSAGTAPGGDLTGVAEVLAERGIGFTPAHRALDMSMAPDLLIVVCEEGCSACPYLPRAAQIVRWPLEDPATLQGPARAKALREIATGLEARIGTLQPETAVGH